MTTTYKIAVLPGDGIGPEVVSVALNVLRALSDAYSTFDFQSTEGTIGGAAIDRFGDPLPAATVALCRDSDAIILGAVGGPKWDNTDAGGVRPEQGLLGIRKELELFANLRPVKIFKALVDSSTIKAEILTGVDMVVVRELTGGLYFGKTGRDGGSAFDTCEYNTEEIERLMRAAFDLARQRRKKVHSVDKANVLETSRLWRETAINVAADFPDVELNHMLVDNCAMQLIRQPAQFDVIATENMFGDILSDEAAMLSASLGMLASASMGVTGLSLYEPSHGSAPDIAGKDLANPIATIMSVSLMLRYSFNLQAEADTLDRAIEAVLDEGLRTADIMQPGGSQVGTVDMGEKIAEAVKALVG